MLKNKLQHAQILPVLIFTVDDWINDKSNIILRINKELGAGPWIVRSSFSGEDKLDSSNAGAFASILNVDKEKLVEAVNTVIASYGDQSLTEEILIQPMLNNVQFAGVAFSHDPNTGSPDRIISWSEGSDTQLVTAGRAGNIWQIAAGCKITTKEELLRPVCDLIEELLSIFKEVPIDCEFALAIENKFTDFQPVSSIIKSTHISLLFQFDTI